MLDKGELGCDDESYRALIGSGAAARPGLAGGLAAAGRSHDEEPPLLPLCKKTGRSRCETPRARSGHVSTKRFLAPSYRLQRQDRKNSTRLPRAPCRIQ